MWFLRRVTSHTNFITYRRFTFALFHKLKRGKKISWTSRTASTQNFHSRALEKQRPIQLWYAATSERSNSRHALKQEVNFVQHNCLFLPDTKGNSACLTQEPRSAFCTALLSKVFAKGSQVSKASFRHSKLKVIEFPRNLWLRRVTAGVQSFVNNTK